MTLQESRAQFKSENNFKNKKNQLQEQEQNQLQEQEQKQLQEQEQKQIQNKSKNNFRNRVHHPTLTNGWLGWGTLMFSIW